MTGWRRNASGDCGCCGARGSCVTAVGDCEPTSTFTFTTPQMEISHNYTCYTGCTCTDAAEYYMPTTTTVGIASCVNAFDDCFMNYRCLDCADTSCQDCDEMNYEMVTVPCIKKFCNGTECGSAGTYNVTWDLGTQSGVDMMVGEYMRTCPDANLGCYNPCFFPYTACWVKWKPTLNTFFAVPAVDYVSTGGGSTWEYAIRWWFPLTHGYVGVHTAGGCGGTSCSCDDLINRCGLDNGWTDVINNTFGMFYYTGRFYVLKEAGSCFGATWNGDTQTASGSGVISITPPDGVAPYGHSTLGQIDFHERCVEASGSCFGGCSNCDCDTVGDTTPWNYCEGTSYDPTWGILNTDPVNTSHGGNCSWSVT